MYKKVDSNLSFVKQEEELIKFWDEHQIFQKSLKQREGAEVYSFYDGPPTANGKPHAGHVLTRVIKDLIPRYQTMKGKYVPRKAGWDTHGLPVELEVEKKLGISSKKQIEDYGVENFIDECKKSVWKYKHEWEVMTKRCGYWVDMEKPYITYENYYIESVWWALKQIFDQGLLYKGHKVVPYCPRCGTALSSHEVAQGYKDVTDTSVYVKFAVSGEANTYFAVWTTTPWTLPSNVALCVNADEAYVLAELTENKDDAASDVDKTEDSVLAQEKPGTRYYVAKALLNEVFGDSCKIIAEYKGSELVGKHYEPILPYAKDIVAKSGQDCFFVTCDDYVTLTDGTGIVHIAPAFGEDDARIGHKNDLPHVQLVNNDGKMSDEVTDFKGVFCKDADAGIIELLAKQGSLLFRQKITHSYPHCWRCDTPLIYYARSTWFIKVSEIKDKLIANNAKINWIPKTIGSGRFGNFLENVVDWGLSRERYWGTPLPIWHCPSCGKWHCVGSIAELKEMAVDCPDDIELHKPMLDAVHLVCPVCGSTMQRETEVIDGWFDSGSMPFAALHYPFENQDIFEKTAPANFISEGIDQTRGWFYTLHAISSLLFDRNAFQNCLVLGHVLDKDGIKMSKHLGNVIDPFAVLDKEGADATRWCFYASSSPWLPTRFSFDAVSDAKRAFLGTLWNTYAFFVLYANIDNFEPQKYGLNADKDKLTVLDRWVLSRFNSLIKFVDNKLAAYDVTAAARALQSFVDELSNWYVRRSRDRFWGSGMPDNKITAYQVLYKVLVNLCKLIAPFTPFVAEAMYQNLVVSHLASAKESVHLEDFPCADESAIDQELESQMEQLLKIIYLGRSARNKAALKIRQPLSKLIVTGASDISEDLQQLIADELNVKDICFSDKASELVSYSFKPQLRTLGKRFGKDLNTVRDLIAKFDSETMHELRAKGTVSIAVNGTDHGLTLDDLIVEEHATEGFSVEKDGNMTVALCTDLTEELISEGYLREIESKIQSMRREINFEVTDRVDIFFSGSDVLIKVLSERKTELLSDILAAGLTVVDASSNFPDDLIVKDWDINGEEAKIGLRKH